MSNKTKAFTTSLALAGALLVSGASIAGHHNGEMKDKGHQHGHEMPEGHHHGMSKDKHGDKHQNHQQGISKDKHGHGHREEMQGHGMKKGAMSKKDHGSMREVMGNGRVNKIMADKHMVNINHEPMPEMNWPKMRMNFKTDESVDLSALKPGQEVDFTLLVDDDNNYLIKEITVK